MRSRKSLGNLFCLLRTIGAQTEEGEADGLEDGILEPVPQVGINALINYLRMLV